MATAECVFSALLHAALTTRAAVTRRPAVLCWNRLWMHFAASLRSFQMLCSSNFWAAWRRPLMPRLRDWIVAFPEVKAIFRAQSLFVLSLDRVEWKLSGG